MKRVIEGWLKYTNAWLIENSTTSGASTITNIIQLESELHRWKNKKLRITIEEMKCGEEIELNNEAVYVNESTTIEAQVKSKFADLPSCGMWENRDDVEDADFGM